MLRLRFPEAVPDGVVDGFPLKLWATNENGSVIKLEKPLCLAVFLVSAETLAPVGGSALAADGIGRPAASTTVFVSCDGTCDSVISISAKPSGKHRYRLYVEPVEAAVVAAWGSRAAVKYTTSHKDTKAPRCVPVLSVHSAAFTLGAVPVMALASPHAESFSCPLLTLSFCDIRLSLCEQQMRILPGFGSICWDAAIMLSHFIVVNKAFFKGKRCVDLGTGTAIVGLTAASIGAHVALTDVADMLPLVDVNTMLNAESIKKADGSVLVTPLMWGEECPATLRTLGGAGTVGEIHVILASEVAYRAEVFSLLCQTFCRLCGIEYHATDSAREMDFDACMASLPEAPSTLDATPVVILGARRRACCEIQDFVAILQDHFTVYKLKESSEAAAGEPRRKLQGGTKPLSGYMPAACSQLSSTARFLSKTEYVPQLFCLVPRRPHTHTKLC